jgi:ethanolamine utilization protein EutM
VTDAIGFLETTGLTPAMAAVDTMSKAALIRILQVEVNDLYGVCVKIAGSVEAVSLAIRKGRRVAERMNGRPVDDVISRLAPEAECAVISPREFNPLIEQEVVFQTHPAGAGAEAAAPLDVKPLPMKDESQGALGLIETQGFTAVFEAIDTACKAASVRVVGKEKLGGGYVTVIIQGELSAVTTAVEAGSRKVEGLGKLIARPSEAVLSLLPKT